MQSLQVCPSIECHNEVCVPSKPGGADFIVTSAQVTIPSDETEACTDIPIIDDDLALEGDEVFEVDVVPPPFLIPPPPSNVFILDNDSEFMHESRVLPRFIITYV